MIKPLAIAVATTCIITPAVAQDLVFSMQATDSCLAGMERADQQDMCIGASAQMCMQDTVGGGSTVGMGGCLSAELGQWDARLNETYQRLMAKEKTHDAEMADASYVVPKKAEPLRDMQRAWISYRDTRCAYVGVQWGGGTGTGPAIVDCTMNMTAQQALFLQNMLNY